MNKSFYTRCTLTKFTTLIVNEYYIRSYLFNFWNLTNFRRLLCEKYDVV